MKRFYLIVILLLPIVMMGQNDSLPQGYIKFGGDTVEFMGYISKLERGKPIFTDDYKEAVVNTIIDLWDEYQTECHNDSTLFKGYVNKITPNGVVWQEWEVVYTHQQPTFTGFIEWLKERSEW